MHRATRTVAAVVSALVVAMAACGSDDDTSDEGGSAPAATAAEAATTAEAGSSSTPAAGKIETIQFVNPLPNYPTWRLIGDCMKEAADARDVELIESGPSGQAIDASLMVSQIQQAIANKRGAIITLPASEGFTPVLEQAQEAGIITGTFYGAEGAADVNAFPDFTAIGEQMVSAIAALPGDHKVGLVAAADTGLGKAWLDGMKAAAETTDNVEIVGEVFTADDAAKALPQVNALLTAHPEINQIATHMGTVTPGAVAAIKQQNKQGEVFLMANGHDNGGAEALEEGTVNLMLMQGVCDVGTAMVNAVIDKSEGKPVPEVPVTIVVADKDDMQSYLDQGYV